MHRVIGILIIAHVLFVVGGCSTPDTGFKATWSESVGAFGLIGVLPPEEDLRVGDFFVFAQDPEAPNAPRMLRVNGAARWGTVDVLSALESEYERRRSWPRTPDDFLQVSCFVRRA